jgi:hypothetical protein
MRLSAGGVAPVLALIALGSAPLLAEAPDEIVSRGVAVCLDAAGTKQAVGGDCPDAPEGGWAIESREGALHRLSPDDTRVAILGDARVRSRDLEVTLWRYADGRLAIVRLRSLIDGRRHDPHYYCPVCAIRASAPGPCWCCQAPFEFREPPLEGPAARE